VVDEIKSEVMKFKAGFILAIFFALQFVSSCCKDHKYFDFDEMTVSLSSSEIEIQDSLVIELIPVNLEFMGFNLSDIGFNSALAFDCDQGWGGMKFPFEKIEITSNEDFDAGHLKGELLNDLFKIRVFTGNGKFEIEPLTAQTELSKGDIKLILSERPQNSQEHIITIKLVKSNSDTIEVQSDKVSWI
jgi:hypothetical protein